MTNEDGVSFAISIGLWLCYMFYSGVNILFELNCVRFYEKTAPETRILYGAGVVGFSCTLLYFISFFLIIFSC